MNPELALGTDELAIVRSILVRILPDNIRVFAFGSRVSGSPKPWSDLDLAIEGNSPLPLALLAELVEAFDESALPWKVDIVDKASVGEGFARIIDAAKVPIL